MSDVILLLGPTASGKTRLAIELVQKYPLEIISVDSAMVYKYMDIGTGKPTKAEFEKAPHALIDFLEPTESYSAAEFRIDALRLIKEIHERNKIPLLVGGTMLYFNALIKGMAELPEADPIIRKQLETELKIEGLEKLHQRLAIIDSVSAKRIHANDPQRILRALEVYQITGKPMSSVIASEAKQSSDGLASMDCFGRKLPRNDATKLANLYSVSQFAIFPDDRVALHQAIAARFQKMLDQGFVEEVQALRNRGDLNLNFPSMRCVGYRQIWQYLEGEFDYQTMQEKAIAATRQLAKRQMTWLRSWENLQCFQDSESLKKEIQARLN